MKTWIEISASAVKNNIDTVRRTLKKGTRLCAVVKANAYGHGLVEMATLAEKYGADWLAVDSTDEGIVLRQNKIKLPIVVLGYTPLKDLAAAVKNNLSLIVYNQETIKALPSGARVHIKVETGTGRQGVTLGHVSDVVCQAKSQGLVIEGLSTHFANVEDTDDQTFFKEQLEKFKQAKKILGDLGEHPICHTACSAAIFLYPETHFDMVRLGISLYGLWSFTKSKQVINSVILEGTEVTDRIHVDAISVACGYLQHDKYALSPVLSWKTIIAQIKELKVGTSIGYGLSERLKRASKVAVIPIGYYDGFDRKLSKIGQVLIGGKRCKILGRVCMNMVMVDVTDVLGVQLEDEVVILGKQGKEEITAEQIAEQVGTINYEIVTRINPWIKRRVV